MALDKTNDYHFVYYNRVIKPALVVWPAPGSAAESSSTGPNIIGPAPSMPVSVHNRRSRPTGRPTVWCRRSIAWSAPGHAWTDVASPARSLPGGRRDALQPHAVAADVSCGGRIPPCTVDRSHQSIFPPDVTAVMDHGKRDVSSVPDRHGRVLQGRLLSGDRHQSLRNIPVPTSYMAHRPATISWAATTTGDVRVCCTVAITTSRRARSNGRGDAATLAKPGNRQLTDETAPTSN